MSLGAEIAFQRIAARLSADRGGAPVALISEFGAGSPGVEAAAPAVRLAWRPALGFRLRPAAVWSPPISLVLAREDAGRAMAEAAIMVDVGGALLAETVALCRALAGRPPDAIRAPLGAPAPEGLAPAFVDRIGGEAVMLGAGIAAEGLFDGLDPEAPGFIDEFDALARCGASALAGLRFTASGGEALIRPAMALDLPDASQTDMALGEGRALFDAGGACSLTVPLLARRAGGIGVAIAGVEGRPAPAVSGPAAAEVRIGRDGERIVLRVAGAGEAVRLDIEFPPDSPGGAPEIVEIWSAVRRRRGGWEDWNEADAQVALEESW